MQAYKDANISFNMNSFVPIASYTIEQLWSFSHKQGVIKI